MPFDVDPQIHCKFLDRQTHIPAVAPIQFFPAQHSPIRFWPGKLGKTLFCSSTALLIAFLRSAR
jgi:hypothetical protein